MSSILRRIACLFVAAGIVQAQQTLDKAWDLAAHGRQPEAIQLLTPLVNSEPSNADARLLLGSLLMEAGRKQESLEQLNMAVRLRPRSYEAQNALGEAYSKFGDLPNARLAFEKTVALKPDYGIGQLNLAQALLGLNQPDEAAKHLDLAIRLLGHVDEAADARYLRAKLYTAQNDTGQAAKLLDQAVAIRPKFAEAWSDLGETRKTLLDDAGALAAFQHAVAANPRDAVAQYRLGAQYLASGDSHKAVASLKAAEELSPEDQSTLNSLQMALRQDGKPEEAAQVRARLADLLKEKDTENQNHLTAIKLNNEGAKQEKAGDLKGALALYSQAASLYPRHSGIHMNYGVALLRTGQWTAGLEELHAALEQDPGNVKLKAALSDALSQAPAGLRPNWADALR